MEPNKE